MGEAARQMAERNFVIERNADRLLEVYRHVCASAG